MVFYSARKQPYEYRGYKFTLVDDNNLETPNQDVSLDLR